ncbi:hypothetical protein [Paenibacillus albiflavus]|uniref:hypothetical protein n=1 Tax=Paenibacillus albiflavus TaxID=2545760 RepID=UPI00140544E0|nr:hypothetical protein [Paenibacillus albiflavus]
MKQIKRILTQVERILLRLCIVLFVILLVVQFLLQFPAIRAVITTIDTLEGNPYLR